MRQFVLQVLFRRISQVDNPPLATALFNGAIQRLLLKFESGNISSAISLQKVSDFGTVSCVSTERALSCPSRSTALTA